jgi:hypothetical protein
MKASEVLRAAADLIRLNGWSVRASARDGDGQPVALWSHTAGGRPSVSPLARRFSIYGAICMVAEGNLQQNPTMMWSVLAQAAMDADETVPGGTNHLHPVMGFNEAPGRTVEQVLALLELAAARCELRDMRPAPIDTGMVPLTREIEVVDASGAVLGSGPIGGAMIWLRQPAAGEEVLTRFKGGA